uniref:Ubiquitin-related modifier 1 n=1 Tax=Capra hircus TaxID=9925 RepID=A0A452F826_CAPHI
MVEFGGGVELLFHGMKKHQVTLPGQEEPWNIQNLFIWVKKNLLKERPELFIAGDSLQPGILLQDQDSALFKTKWEAGAPQLVRSVCLCGQMTQQLSTLCVSV